VNHTRRNILPGNCTVQVIILVLVILTASDTFSQQKVKLLSSDYVEGGRKGGTKYNMVRGHVHFIQGTTEIFCDSAFFYKKQNSVEAFGHIRIFDIEDSTTIRSDKLVYSGNTKFAQLRDNVVYQDDSIILYTNFLDYNVVNKSAHYYNNGKIINGQNVLTSVTGFYDTRGKSMSFYKKVVLENPQNTLKSDTLLYNMITEIARTFGPSTIISSDGTNVYSEKGGEFLMRSKQTTIESGTIETESYILRGRKLYYDQIHQTNRAEGNIYMYSKKEDIIITGDHAENYEGKGITKIYGNPVMHKLFLLDTLYLAADTLVSIDIKHNNDKRLLAFHHVRFFRFDMQGIADSISYVMNDSTLFLYNDPVLWTGNNQIEGDSVNIVFKNNQIDRMSLIDNSFIILTDTSGNYNQLKGKKMTAFFINNVISQLDVFGNSECLFHALNEIDNSLTGINRILCSNMTIRFVNKKADNMTFYTNPDASFIPPHEIQEPDRHLTGFNWRDKERPTLKMVLEPYVEIPKPEKSVTREKHASQ
jgi:lipopolysaccharide export system protein LptA